jgi:hypothetical protein
VAEPSSVNTMQDAANIGEATTEGAGSRSTEVVITSILTVADGVTWAIVGAISACKSRDKMSLSTREFRIFKKVGFEDVEANCVSCALEGGGVAGTAGGGREGTSGTGKRQKDTDVGGGVTGRQGGASDMGGISTAAESEQSDKPSLCGWTSDCSRLVEEAIMELRMESLAGEYLGNEEVETSCLSLSTPSSFLSNPVSLFGSWKYSDGTADLSSFLSPPTSPRVSSTAAARSIFGLLSALTAPVISLQDRNS